MEGRWIREVKGNLRRYGIGEDEFEELEWKELDRKMKDWKERDWQDGVRSKKSLCWYGRWRKKERGLMNWESNKTDRIMKRYWSGVMKFRIGCETERCACVRKR